MTITHNRDKEVFDAWRKVVSLETRPRTPDPYLAIFRKARTTVLPKNPFQGNMTAQGAILEVLSQRHTYMSITKWCPSNHCRSVEPKAYLARFLCNRYLHYSCKSKKLWRKSQRELDYIKQFICKLVF